MRREVKTAKIRYQFLAIIGALSTLLSSCISNDIPYPVVDLVITNVEGDGFVMETPDYTNKIITLVLDETTDISNVRITNVDYSPEAELSKSVIGTFDLRTPLNVVLSLYQDYEWSIVAKQNIERSFKVEGQIGVEQIDTENFTAKVYVSESVDLANVTIKELKLGPEGITTISPSIDQITYFETYRKVEVSYHSFKQSWRLYVEPTDVVVSITKCDVWAKIAHLAAAGDSSGDCGFYYRKAGEEWQRSTDEVKRSEGAFTTTITGLEPNCAYEFKAFSNEDESESQFAESEDAPLLENGGFELWSKPSITWFPYLDVASRFWDSGNTGSSTILNLTTPCQDDVRPGSDGEYSARLQSYYALVKFAAGNIFIGRYVQTVGTNGIVGFGQPFVQRPVALRGWVKYNCGVVNYVGSNPPGENIVVGESTDTGAIYIALGTWSPEEYGVSNGVQYGDSQTPLIVDTKNPSTFFNPKSEAVVAYGQLLLTESQEEWMEFTIPLDYTTTSEIPTHLIIVASASRYGDYFTGSTDSMMWIDDFELIYE